MSENSETSTWRRLADSPIWAWVIFASGALALPLLFSFHWAKELQEEYSEFSLVYEAIQWAELIPLGEILVPVHLNPDYLTGAYYALLGLLGVALVAGLLRWRLPFLITALAAGGFYNWGKPWLKPKIEELIRKWFNEEGRLQFIFDWLGYSLTSEWLQVGAFSLLLLLTATIAVRVLRWPRSSSAYNYSRTVIATIFLIFGSYLGFLYTLPDTGKIADHWWSSAYLAPVHAFYWIAVLIAALAIFYLFEDRRKLTGADNHSTTFLWLMLGAVLALHLSYLSLPEINSNIEVISTDYQNSKEEGLLGALSQPSQLDFSLLSTFTEISDFRLLGFLRQSEGLEKKDEEIYSRLSKLDQIQRSKSDTGFIAETPGSNFSPMADYPRYILTVRRKHGSYRDTVTALRGLENYTQRPLTRENVELWLETVRQRPTTLTEDVELFEHLIQTERFQLAKQLRAHIEKRLNSTPKFERESPILAEESEESSGDSEDSVSDTVEFRLLAELLAEELASKENRVGNTLTLQLTDLPPGKASGIPVGLFLSKSLTAKNKTELEVIRDHHPKQARFRFTDSNGVVKFEDLPPADFGVVVASNWPTSKLTNDWAFQLTSDIPSPLPLTQTRIELKPIPVGEYQFTGPFKNPSGVEFQPSWTEGELSGFGRRWPAWENYPAFQLNPDIPQGQLTDKLSELDYMKIPKYGLVRETDNGSPDHYWVHRTYKDYEAFMSYSEKQLDSSSENESSSDN